MYDHHELLRRTQDRARPEIAFSTYINTGNLYK
jgi:hypothetical protein